MDNRKREISATFIKNIVSSIGKEAGDISYTTFYANQSYIKKNPEVIESFTRAIYKGQQFVEKSSADYVIFFGEEMSKAKSFVTSKKLDAISTSDENAVDFVAKKLKDFCSKDDIVLLKANHHK